jgi:hypothetical protein
VHVYATTTVALPFSNWILLSNPVVSSNGQLRVEGISVTNSSLRFFRAAEAP